MIRRLFTITLLILGITTISIGQDWNRYISAKKGERKNIKGKATKSGSVKKLLGPGVVVIVTWITDPVARAIVSDKVDEERLSQDEAEKKYSELRRDGLYSFYGQVLSRDKGIGEPLNSKAIFLQRAEDHSSFVRAEKAIGKFEGVQSYFDNYTYTITFPRLGKNGQAIVRSLDDVVELSISTHAGTLTVEYKIKNFVTRLEDL
jgi:hypothetical protein